MLTNFLCSHLADAIPGILAHIIKGRMDEYPPYTEPPFPVPEEQRVTVFDWMVLTCYPAEFRRQHHLATLATPDQVDTAPAPQDQRSDAARLRMD